MKSNVLLVDDSRLVREVVRDLLVYVPDAEICGEATNGREALELIESKKPDLVIMDVEMPELDGISTLREIRDRGLETTVVILSVLTQKGAAESLEAMSLGAVDFIPKPSPTSGIKLDQMQDLVVQKVRGILYALREKKKRRENREVAPATPVPSRPVRKIEEQYRLVVIGSSTGGPQALQKVFTNLPADFPVPIVVVQHMPPVFTAAFAERLNHLSGLTVTEASEGVALEPASVYIAPGDRHVELTGGLAEPRLRLSDAPPVFSHKPSIDVTLQSAVENFNDRMIAVLMTGMGRDGVAGMKAARERGGLTVAQDEESSVVFGMNRRAIEEEAADLVIPLDDIAGVLQQFF